MKSTGKAAVVRRSGQHNSRPLPGTRMLRLLPAALVAGWLVAGCASNEVAPASQSPEPPPIVSCGAWAIVDGRSGELLWEHDAVFPRKAASTTKIMCAYVVLSLAQQDRGILRERVVFSEDAADTSGSTCHVEAGESVTVEECLYALLLPSGNDAGNALAEHFNGRFSPPAKPASTTESGAKDYRGGLLGPRAAFVAEMNRTAQRLGLEHTVYRTPFGDGGGENGRTTSARELAALAFEAMKDPLFRKVVSTRRYACEVVRPAEEPRQLVWENTNELLKFEGYDGIKTGTNTGAGACLVASGSHGRDRLIVVVLGSTSSEGRYVDARNLFRWAWRQRQR